MAAVPAAATNATYTADESNDPQAVNLSKLPAKNPVTTADLFPVVRGGKDSNPNPQIEADETVTPGVPRWPGYGITGIRLGAAGLKRTGCLGIESSVNVVRPAQCRGHHGEPLDEGNIASRRLLRLAPREHRV